MSDFPYLGNRISLISSSQIRYEGILYTIDTVQGTVTLAQVRSFGTEDRATERPVAERDEIYDFIVFRGADIKDIKLCNVQKTYDDPAIVEMGSSTAGSSAPGGPLATAPRLSAPPPPQQAFSAPPPAAGAAFPMNGAAAAGGAVSRLPAAAAAPGGPVASRESHGLISGPTFMDYAAAPHAKAPSSAAAAGGDLAGSSRSTTPSRRSPTMDQGVQTQQQNQEARGQHPRPPRGGYNRGQGGGGYRGAARGGRRGGRGGAGRGTFAVSTRPIKFDGDFDFEEANKKFEELAAQLAKTKIEEGSAENGEMGGAEGGEAHEDGEIVEEPAVEFYNKTKSFFDNISCDAAEKARDSRQRRQDWQKERKQNLETFGVEGTRRPYRRGGYRGYNRGGFYGHRGAGGGGGYYNRGGFGGGRGFYNNRGYYNNYNRGYGYGGRRGGAGDGTFSRGGRSERGASATDTRPRAETVQN